MSGNKSVELNSSNVRELLDSIDVVLSDCDGVLWKSETPIPGAPDAVRKLKKMGKKVFFVTNNSIKSRNEYLHKFAHMGYDVVEDDIFPTSYVTAEYIKNKFKYSGKVYCIGTPGLGHELQLCGLEPIGIGPDTLDGKTLVDLESYPMDPGVGCVVVGLDYEFTFVKAAKAVAYLENKNCLFLATNSDNRIPTSSGRAMPCCGSILSMIQTASQRRPDAICGKPDEPMYDILQRRLKLNKRRTLFIGDRLNTDILFAGRAGFHSLLVLSGVHNLDDVRCKESSLSDEDNRSIPNYYISSLGGLATLI